MQRVGYFVASTVATRKAAAASRDRAVSAERGWPLIRDRRRDERAVLVARSPASRTGVARAGPVLALG